MLVELSPQPRRPLRQLQDLAEGRRLESEADVGKPGPQAHGVEVAEWHSIRRRRRHPEKAGGQLLLLSRPLKETLTYLPVLLYAGDTCSFVIAFL